MTAGVDPLEDNGEANGVEGRVNFFGGGEGLCIDETLLFSSSSSSEDGAGIGNCTGAWSLGLGVGGAQAMGLLGKDDSSKTTSVEVLIVRVFLSQSRYPFELDSYPMNVISEDCDSNLLVRFFLGRFT